MFCSGGVTGDFQRQESKLRRSDSGEASDVPAQEARLPAGLVLKPPLSIQDLAANVDHDPAEALVALIRQMRREGTTPQIER